MTCSKHGQCSITWRQLSPLRSGPRCPRPFPLLGFAEFLGRGPGLPQVLVFGPKPLIFSPQLLVAEPTGLFVGHGLDHARGVRIDGRTAIATLLRPPCYRSPSPTENRRRIANPLFNR